MLAQRVAAMFDELRDQVVAMVQEHEQQGSQVTELQGQLAAQTQRVEALEAELQGLRQLLVQDAEESETETRTPPSPAHKVDSPTSGSDGSETRSDEEIELSRRAIANLLLKKLYARVGAEAEKTTEVEAFPQVEEPPDDGPEVTQWRCVWRPGMDIRGERSVQRKGVVGFLSSGEVFDVVEEWPGREGTVFLKLAGDKGWVFNKTRTGTFCVPVGSEWQDWRGSASTSHKDENHKPWTANDRDHQQQAWNNSPSWNGRDREGEQGSRSSSSWKGKDDTWAWDQKDHHVWHHEQHQAWTTKEWNKSWGHNGQNKTESRNGSW
mmetsp:Transcript_13129/g.27463  ORF Transcript_13129/g.27463 Transcript_13129/m.27463 type:complete len:322 (-) Transcript_13129:144-1109(-)